MIPDTQSATCCYDQASNQNIHGSQDGEHLGVGPQSHLRKQLFTGILPNMKVQQQTVRLEAR